MKRIAIILSALLAANAFTANQYSQHAANQAAFNEVKDSISPLSDDQVRDIRKLFNNMNRMQAYTGDVPAKPVSTTVSVDLAPGATPPVIRLGAGYISSVLFLDSTGEPWPIKAIDIGNPSLFNVQWNKSTAGEDTGDTMLNTLLIQSKTMFKEGNIAVMLRGMNTPVMITLIPGQKVIDYRVDMQIPRRGPNAKVEYQVQPSGANPLLLDVLNGVKPIKAKAVKIHGSVSAQGWKIGKTLFIRMKETVLSPGWFSTMSAADGTMHAYEMPLSSTILILDNGQVRKLTVEGT